MNEIPPVVFEVLAQISSAQANLAKIVEQVELTATQVQAALARMDLAAVGVGNAETEMAVKSEEAGERTKKSGEKGALGLKQMAEALALFKAYEFVKESVKAFEQAQVSTVLLDRAIKNAHGDVAAFRGPIASVDAQMRNFGFTNIQTETAVARLTGQLHNPAKALNLVGLAADLARARHMDLVAASQLVGRAATGNVAILARYGIQTKDAAGHTLSARAAIEKLAETFHGTASAYSGTLAGQMDKLHAQMEDAKEQVGKALVPVLNEVIPIFVELAKVIGNDVAPALSKAIGFYQKHHVLINTIAIALGTVIAAYKVWKMVTEAMIVAQAALDLVLDANPIGVIIVAIMALVAALVYAYKHSETFRNIVHTALRDVEIAFGHMAGFVINDVIKPLVTFWLWWARMTVDGAAKAFGWIPGLGGKLKAAQHTIDEFAKGTQETLNGWANNMYNIGEGAGRNLGAGLVSGLSQEVPNKPGHDLMGGLISNAAGTAKKAYQTGYNIGSNYGAGLSTATKSAKTAADAAAKELLQSGSLKLAQAAQAVAAAHGKPSKELLKRLEELKRQAQATLYKIMHDPNATAGDKSRAEAELTRATNMINSLNKKSQESAKKHHAELEKLRKEHDRKMAELRRKAEEERRRKAEEHLKALRKQLEEEKKILKETQDALDRLKNERFQMEIVNMQLANVGTSLLNLGTGSQFGPAPGPQVTVNVAGSVVAEQHLVSAVQQGMLVTQRTNSSLGIKSA